MVIKCKSCGGNVVYDIGSKRLVCKTCGNSFIIDEYETDTEKTFDARAYRCQDCGATLITLDDTVATASCSYCGSQSILSERLEKLKKPDKIVPFSITEDECRRAYLENAKDSFLTPSWIKKETTTDAFRPIYMPYWRYTVHAEVDQSTYKYSISIKRIEDTEITTTIKTPYARHANLNYIAETHDASKAFSDDISKCIGFNVNDVKNDREMDFHPAYLSGLYADMADDLAQEHEQMLLRREKALAGTGHDPRISNRSFSGTTARDTNNWVYTKDPTFEIVDKELIYYPVWFMSRRIGKKVIYAAVNGYNGKVVADHPISTVRFLALAGALAVLAFLLLSLVLVLRPEPAFWVTTLMSAAAVIGCNRFYKMLEERADGIGVSLNTVPRPLLLMLSLFALIILVMLLSSRSNLVIYLAAALAGVVVIINCMIIFSISKKLSAHKPPQFREKGGEANA